MDKIYTFFTKFLERHKLMLLVFIYLTTRLINLDLLPIFNDEAIWIDWGYRAVNLKGFLFYSLLDAKPPLLMWLFGLMQKIISDPLIAGRTVSVIFGLITLLGIYKTSQELFSQKLAYIASILYIVNPLFLFFDRQALLESAISACGIWAFYFLYKLVETGNRKYAFSLGLTLGIGYFIKSNTLIFLSVCFALLAYHLLKLKKERALKGIENLLFIFGVFLLTIFPLIMQEAFWTSLPQNSKYALTLSELFKFPISTWFKNISSFFEIFLVYFNPLVFVSFLTSIYLLLKSKNGVQKLFIYFSVCVFFLLFIARSINPRYVVSFLPLSTIVTALSINKIITKNIITGTLITIFIISPSIIISWLLIFQPLTYFDVLNKFSIHSQKSGYVEGWTSGYGFKEVKTYLDNISKDKKIIVGVRSDAGIPENAVFAYFLKSKNVTPIIFDSQILPPEIFDFDCIKSSVPFYFVSRDAHLTNLNKFFEDVERFYKPSGANFIGIHRLKENCQEKTLQIN